ncbi:Sensor protein CpxA [compost metagenome]
MRDHGPGIPDAALEDVFVPFFRLESSRNRDTGGVGLGLPSARTAIREQGGELTLRNAPDGGLLARIVLPRVND